MYVPTLFPFWLGHPDDLSNLFHDFIPYLLVELFQLIPHSSPSNEVGQDASRSGMRPVNGWCWIIDIAIEREAGAVLELRQRFRFIG
jgi:hypothetical protein